MKLTFKLWCKKIWHDVSSKDSDEPVHILQSDQLAVWKSLTSRLQSERQNLIRARGYKTFFMLNSAEHEIFSANKYENANKNWHFHIY